jgi:hypothetical protein
MSESRFLSYCLLFLLTCTIFSVAQATNSVVVFIEPDFPVADTASASPQQLHAALPNARFTSAGELGSALKDTGTRVLMLPYGSAFPENSWDDIFGFLQRGGNLLVLG